MENIVLNDGKKAYTINEDENRVIRFNPSDLGILSRTQEIIKGIENEIKKNEKRKNKKNILDLGDYIKSQIDYVFNSEIADIVFEKTHPMTSIDGVPYYQQFLTAVTPIILKEAEKERNASEERMKKYTEKYKKGGE